MHSGDAHLRKTVLENSFPDPKGKTHFLIAAHSPLVFNWNQENINLLIQSCLPKCNHYTSTSLSIKINGEMETRTHFDQSLAI